MIKKVISSMLIITLLSSTILQSKVFSEDATINATTIEQPVVTLVKPVQQIVAPGDTVQIEADVIDSENTIDYIYVQFKLGTGYSSLNAGLRYNEKTQKYSGSFKVPAGYENAKWNLTTVNISEKNGKYYGQKIGNEQLNDVYLIVYNGVDKQAPELTLPNTSMNMYVNEAFNPMQDVKAFDIPEGDITSNVKVIGKVDTTHSGSYELIYRVSDQAGLMTEKKRTIQVVDTVLPILTVKQDTLKAYIQQGETYIHQLIKENASASDNEDGDITKGITYSIEGGLKISGTKTITYIVKDSSNNQVKKTAKLDLQSFPETNYITGVEKQIVLVNEPFDAMANVRASDAYGEPLKVDIDGLVNTAIEGNYELTYTFTNRIGQEQQKKRQIIVKAKAKPYFVGETVTTVEVGSNASGFEGIEAFDMHEQRLDMSGYGSFNTDVVGTYTVYIEAVDRYKQTVKMTRTLHVVEPGKLPSAFTDVPLNHAFYKEILAMKNAGIINGYPSGEFKPSQSMERQHVALLIFKSGIDLKPIRAEKMFTDVPKSHIYYNEIQTLYRAGIIDGDAGKFRPNATLTRQELAKILVLAYDLQDLGGYDDVFTDMKRNNWSYSYVTTLASHKITIGAYGKFDPLGKVSRQHFAAFMYRALNK